MNLPDDPLFALARRLRELREAGLAGRSITQRQLAKALSTTETASAPLISSWENPKNSVVPPVSRLEAYATFFATARSVADNSTYQLLQPNELTEDEQNRREDLLAELLELRNAAVGAAESEAVAVDDVVGLSAPTNLWQFQEDQDITIICAELPEGLRRGLSYANPESPDYVKLYRFTDLDALLEIHGHIRSVNPNSHVNVRTPFEAMSDLLTAHLVVLGGVDWNPVTRDVLRLIDIPVSQEARAPGEQIEGFEVGEGNQRTLLKPTIREVGEGTVELLEDVAHFYRGPNPLNQKRTVTICNGMFGRGTLGAVRTLTDPRFLDRNTEYVRRHFGQTHTFSIVSRVLILSGEVVTPDWTRESIRLHEWPKESGEQRNTRGVPGSV